MEQTCGRNPGTQLSRGGNTRLRWSRLKGEQQHELSRLERKGSIERERVDSSDYACPIVPIVKTNGKLCICGDYRATVNTATKTDQYSIPRIEDIYFTLNGVKSF